MTQFAIFKSSVEHKNLKRLKSNELNESVKTQYFGNDSTDSFYEFSDGNHTIDTLLLKVQSDIAAGLEVREIKELNELIELIKSCDRSVFWYSDDYIDLPIIDDIHNVEHEILESVASPSCETYFVYERQK